MDPAHRSDVLGVVVGDSFTVLNMFVRSVKLLVREPDPLPVDRDLGAVEALCLPEGGSHGNVARLRDMDEDSCSYGQGSKGAGVSRVPPTSFGTTPGAPLPGQTQPLEPTPNLALNLLDEHPRRFDEQEPARGDPPDTWVGMFAATPQVRQHRRRSLVSQWSPVTKTGKTCRW